jgi:hypothetical protein
VLNIYLYGPNQSGTSDPYTVPGQGALCNGQLVANQSGPCGIPWSVWSNNGTSPLTMPGAGANQDYFYDYGPNYGDGLCSDGRTQWSPTAGCGAGSLQVGYFGYKVLAVSYGGTLQLFGYKGTPLPKPPTKRPLVNVLPGLGQGSGGSQNPLAALLHSSAPSQSQDTAATAAAGATATPQPNPAVIDADPKNTGYSWMRLAASLSTEGAGTKNNPNTLTLSKSPGDRWWSTNDAIPDQVVVTTNFSQLADIVPEPSNGMCLPSNFCTASGEPCGCALTADSPQAKLNPGILAQCQQACSVWSVKDLDFPPNGVYGFAFTLPSGFTTAPYTVGALGPPNRPGPSSFPTVSTNSLGPDWLTQFVNTAIAPDNASPSQCYYPTLPGSGSCPVTYPNPTEP